MTKQFKKVISLVLTVTIFLSMCYIGNISASANCTANSVISIAQAEVGTTSGYHKRNKYTLWLGKISGYEDSGYGYPWCATFTSWCASQAGCLDIISKTASCNVQWANTQGAKHYTSSGYIPQKGDLIFFDYGTSHSSNSLDHVGFVEYYDSATGIVHTIEGNYNNSVAKVKRNYYSNDIYGFISPNYIAESKPTDPTGCVDSITGTDDGNIKIRGWAFDRDDVNAEISLHVYINGEHYATLKADKSRPDVNDVYSDVGNNHGFEDVLIVNKSGNLNVKVFAINVGNGSNVLLENGEKNVTVTADPSTPKIIKECTLDGHTYKVYACTTTWENAKAICESKGGYLATITSEREQFALYKLLSEYSPNNFYLGGTSISGSWKWVTDEPFSYAAWAESQPDCAGNNEFYLGVYKHDSSNPDLNIWNDFTNNYSGITGFVFESGDLEENKVEQSDHLPTISYAGLIGDYWTENSENGEIIGTENIGRFKAIKIGLKNCTGGIKYSAHFANIGWSDYVQDSEICGSTTNDMSSIEAIKLELYGDVANSYNVFYCAYVRDKGWLEWAKNGEISGSTGGSLPITAIKVMLVPQVQYASHIEYKGWTDKVKDREISGTVGEKLQLEALQIYLKDTSYGNIYYKTHLSDLGWGSSVYNGKESGTTSLSLQAEALIVNLDGKANELFDVMYKVHIQNKGWTSWVRNGTLAGTTGEVLRMEAFKVMVVPKGYIGTETFKEYTPEVFTITFDPMDGECDIKTKPISYCGFYENLPTPQKEGCTFIGWYDSKDYKNLITNASTLETKSNVTLYARWADTIVGDVDGNGEVTIMDVTYLQMHLARYVDNGKPLIDETDETTLAIADIDGDGVLTINDATALQMKLAGYNN